VHQNEGKRGKKIISSKELSAIFSYEWPEERWPT
jgi:hypothetical protein